MRNLPALNPFLVIVLSLAFISPVFCQKKTGGKKSGTKHISGRQFLLRDEGLSQLSFVNLADTTANWQVPVPKGRDIQPVGNGRVLIGTENGYEEREIASGKKVAELAAFPGTIAARRLRNGNTILIGLNWQGKEGIVLVEVDDKGAIRRTIVYTGFAYARLVRETPKGTFLITSNDIVFEGNASGTVIWKASTTGREKPHAWQAVRLANGQTVLSGGYTGDLHVFAPDGSVVKKITGPEEVKPNFFAGMQVLANGNYVVTNWQGHGAGRGANGTQLLEYSPDGKLVWSWKQHPEKFSSLQGVVVLDGLDTDLLHVENEDGALAPVKPGKGKSKTSKK